MEELLLLVVYFLGLLALPSNSNDVSDTTFLGSRLGKCCSDRPERRFIFQNWADLLYCCNIAGVKVANPPENSHSSSVDSLLSTTPNVDPFCPLSAHATSASMLHLNTPQAREKKKSIANTTTGKKKVLHQHNKQTHHTTPHHIAPHHT